MCWTPMAGQADAATASPPGTDTPPRPSLVPAPQEGEARTVRSFREDPYGCGGELLAKRLRRDPFAVGPIHPSRCPEMRGLLGHCGPEMYRGHLPWLMA